MRHGCSPWAALGLAGVLIGAPAAAVTISYVEDLREIHAYSFSRYGSDHGDLRLQPSPAFSDFSTGIAFQQGAAWQVSFLQETSMWARGFARGEPDVLADGSGTSFFDVAFTIDEATPWTLSGVLEREAGPIGYNSANARVVLSSGGSVIFSHALPPNPCCGSGYYDPLSVPVLASGELAPGEYELLIEATSLQGYGTAFFDFAIVLPEPHAGVLILAALAGALARPASLRRS
jgi:hypothetical protein